jgi:hypothetical protein
MQGLFIFHPIQNDDPFGLTLGQNKISFSHPAMKIEGFFFEAVFFAGVFFHSLKRPLQAFLHGQV